MQRDNLSDAIREKVLEAAGGDGVRESIDIGIGKDVTLDGDAVTLFRK